MWINYQWKRHNGLDTVQVGWLYAKNLHHAKHLVSMDSQTPKGEWIDRKDCSILPIPDSSEYLSLETFEYN